MDRELLNKALELGAVEVEPKRGCINCGANDFVVFNYEKICTRCDVIDSSYHQFPCTDYTCHIKITYSRVDRFKKTLQQYQGNQITNIPDKVYDTLQNIVISRESILKCLKKLKLTKYYKDTHRIYFDLTGEKVDNIEHLEHKLVQEYRLFIDAYYKLEFDRKNFPSVEYVLYRMLIRYGHPCIESNFNLPKTEKSRLFHEQLCDKIFGTV